MNRLFISMGALFLGIASATVALSDPPACNVLMPAEPSECTRSTYCGDIDVEDCSDTADHSVCSIESEVVSMRCVDSMDYDTVCIMDWTNTQLCWQQYACYTATVAGVEVCTRSASHCYRNGERQNGYTGDPWTGECENDPYS